MNKDQWKNENKAIQNSCREDYRTYVDNILSEMEAADAVGNIRELSRLTKVLGGRTKQSLVMPSKDLNGKPITSIDQQLKAWNTFLDENLQLLNLTQIDKESTLSLQRTH